MKKTLMLCLVAVFALGAAGITWAAYPSAEAPAAPALDAVAAETSAIEAFEAENEALGADLEALFDEPVQVADGCCWAECHNARTACMNGCGTNQACMTNCFNQFQSCTSHC